MTGRAVLSKDLSYSEYREDLLIERLLRKDTFPCAVDIGALNGVKKSNVARLILRHGWSAVMVEANELRAEEARKLYAGYPVIVHTAHAQITNVKKFLPECFDVLSIDIDGQDYYIWRAIDRRPQLVVIEYNAGFAGGHRVMPQDDDYRANRAWPKLKNFGASAEALNELADEKGYDEVGRTLSNIIFQRR